jgi:uncharacterized SAM-binding protein YcdF (DUF218 family)
MKIRSSFLMILILVLAALWLNGFLSFIDMIGGITEPVINDALSPTEAIVVLTGGSDRLTTGLELLAAGKGRKLLISGVHPGLTLNRVLAKYPVKQELRDCCIVLGHAADNTVGNAEETLAWMQAEKFHSLRLVTAHYHMPRSLMIFHELLPDMEIVPHPVIPDSVKLDDWWQTPHTASLLVMEYNKYLFARLRLWLETLQ